MSAPGDGPRAVRYVLVASPLLVTLFWESRVHATESWQERCLFGLRYSLFNLAFGWWGLPWGPIRTVQACFRNLTGVDAAPEPNDAMVPG